MPDTVTWVREPADQLCTCTDIRSLHDGACTGRQPGGAPCPCKGFVLAEDQGH